MSLIGGLDWSAGYDRQPRGGAFEAVHLPDGTKEQLARSLLAEFGVT